MIHRRPGIRQIVETLRLEPLPTEGGLFVQSHRADESLPADALPERYPRRPKPFGTAIYYLLTADADSFSALHRLPTDEIFHFYLGDPLETLLLYPDGSSRLVTMGSDILGGQLLQAVMPRLVWQGSILAPGGEYALIGTTMAPGFTVDDYEGGDRDELVAGYPREAERIRRLTRPHSGLKRP